MITRTAYKYTVTYKRDDQDQSNTLMSFTPMSRGDIVVEIIDESPNINISNLNIDEKVVVVGMEDEDFLAVAKEVNRKSNKKVKEDNDNE